MAEHSYRQGDEAYEPRGIPHTGIALRMVIETFEEAFPNRVRGYYVHGSVADDTGLETSDLDLDVVVKRDLGDAAERARFAETARAVAARCDLELDIEVTDEASLLAGAEPTFKLGSWLVYGEDIRPQVPLIPLEDWGRERMYRGYFLLVRVFNRPSPVRYPVGFPDPDAEFFGYTERRVRTADGSSVPSTRDLVRVTGWLAKALVAHEGKRYVARKRDCHRLYRERFGDEWASLLEEIYTSCRGRWCYLIPTGPGERNHLRTICRRTLAFENHFLTRFKPFILAELRRARRGEQNRALRLMKDIPLDDDEVRAAVSDVVREG
ncbi:MAG: hypothetical protein JOZ41_22800 [Chloroflexi bacterium]|nr:hypothetical protein [Chloroflexota bacterium]